MMQPEYIQPADYPTQEFTPLDSAKLDFAYYQQSWGEATDYGRTNLNTVHTKAIESEIERTGRLILKITAEHDRHVRRETVREFLKHPIRSLTHRAQ